MVGRTSTLSGTTMTTFVGATINQPPGPSGFALRTLKTRKTYTTSWDITIVLIDVP